MAAVKNNSIVSEALTQALEKMAFLAVEPCDEQLEEPSSIVNAEIGFEGSVSGTLNIAAGVDFARVLAENISGMMDLDEQQCVDVMKELVNVTCGLVLPMIGTSRKDVFNLTLPHLTRKDEQPYWNEFVKQDDVTVVNVEGWPVATRLTIETS